MEPLDIEDIDGDVLRVEDVRGHLTLEGERDGYALDRAGAIRLRDALTEWLGDAPRRFVPPTLVAFRDAYLAYRETCSEVGQAAAHVARGRYLDARRAWLEAGAPVGGEGE